MIREAARLQETMVVTVEVAEAHITLLMSMDYSELDLPCRPSQERSKRLLSSNPKSVEVTTANSAA